MQQNNSSNKMIVYQPIKGRHINLDPLDHEALAKLIQFQEGILFEQRYMNTHFTQILKLFVKYARVCSEYNDKARELGELNREIICMADLLDFECVDMHSKIKLMVQSLRDEAVFDAKKNPKPLVKTEPQEEEKMKMEE